MTIFTEPVILTGIGGLASQLLSLIELQTVPKAQRPDFKDFIFWLPYIITPFISCVIGYAYFHQHPPDNGLLAIHIGVSAPLILRTMASVVPKAIKI